MLFMLAMIQHWRTLGDNATVEQSQQENKRLRKQLKRTEMERGILEKATACFAWESR